MVRNRPLEDGPVIVVATDHVYPGVTFERQGGDNSSGLDAGQALDGGKQAIIKRGALLGIAVFRCRRFKAAVSTLLAWKP